MKTSLAWKKRFLKSTYEIYSGNNSIGMLKENNWSGSAEGEIHGKKYIFSKKGLFKSGASIIDPISNNVVAEISFNTWKTRATIKTPEYTADWKYDNWMNTKWSIYHPGGILVLCDGSTSKGFIENNAGDDLLVLAGLYITNYFWQAAAAVVIVTLVPIWVSVAL